MAVRLGYISREEKEEGHLNGGGEKEGSVGCLGLVFAPWEQWDFTKFSFWLLAYRQGVNGWEGKKKENASIPNLPFFSSFFFFIIIFKFCI